MLSSDTLRLFIDCAVVVVVVAVHRALLWSLCFERFASISLNFNRKKKYESIKIQFAIYLDDWIILRCDNGNKTFNWMRTTTNTLRYAQFEMNVNNHIWNVMWRFCFIRHRDSFKCRVTYLMPITRVVYAFTKSLNELMNESLNGWTNERKKKQVNYYECCCELSDSMQLNKRDKSTFILFENVINKNQRIRMTQFDENWLSFHFIPFRFNRCDLINGT